MPGGGHRVGDQRDPVGPGRGRAPAADHRRVQVHAVVDQLDRDPLVLQQRGDRARGRGGRAAASRCRGAWPRSRRPRCPRASARRWRRCGRARRRRRASAAARIVSSAPGSSGAMVSIRTCPRPALSSSANSAGDGVAQQRGVVGAAAGPGDVRALEVDAGQHAVVAQLGQAAAARASSSSGAGDQAGHHRRGAVAPCSARRHAPAPARRSGTSRPLRRGCACRRSRGRRAARPGRGPRGGRSVPDVRDAAVFDGQPPVVDSLRSHDAGVGECEAHEERITDRVRCRGSSGSRPLASAAGDRDPLRPDQLGHRVEAGPARTCRRWPRPARRRPSGAVAEHPGDAGRGRRC